MKKHIVFDLELVKKLRRGGVGVIPTDTIYGVVGSALLPRTVLRIYRLRKRSLKKPMIVLIGAVPDLKTFGVRLLPTTHSLLTRYWPGKVSIILPIRDTRYVNRFDHLHRGTKALAFRLPAARGLRALLQKTGPLVAPSANPEGTPPARTIAEAKKYFGDRVDFYVDGGRRNVKPSKLISLLGNVPVVLRK